MEIRNLQPSEMIDAVRLSEFAFQYELSDTEREERSKTLDPKQTWGGFIEGRLASKLTILDLHIWIHGKTFPMGGIAGVATWPEYRRQGMVGQLIRHGLKVMKAQGQSVSLLAPFSYSFYRKYGWEMLTELKKYEIDIAKLPRYSVNSGTIRRVGQDIDLLNSIYERFACNYNGMLVRPEQWWRNHVFARKQKQATAAVYYSPDGNADGYILYDVKERQCTIYEWVSLTPEASRAIWKFVADHDSMIDKVVVRMPLDDQLPFLLLDPRIKHENEPCFMARIVDVESFLNEYSWDCDHSHTRLRLAICDDHAEWNQGLYEIRRENNHIQCHRMDDHEADGTEIRCDIQSLSVMLFGYKRPRFLHAIDRLEGEAAAVAALEQWIPARTTCFLDFF